MNIIKQDVGVWVKAEIIPDESGFYMCKKVDETVSLIRFDKQKEVFENYRAKGNVTHWLKPIKQVFVLTEDELNEYINEMVYRYESYHAPE